MPINLMVSRVGKKLTLGFVGLMAGGLLVGCDEEKKVPVEVTRAIKTIVVKAEAPTNKRQISGLVGAVNKSNLSFQVGGSVAKVSVNTGDRVKKGQVLAKLDDRQYRLNTDAAEAELRRAKSSQVEKESRFKAQEGLFKKGVTAKTAFDKAVAEYSAAKEAVKQADAKLSLSKRDLRNTELRAPFAGVIAKREIEPAVVVTAGKTVFEIQGDGDLEVEANVPDTMIKRLKKGQVAYVTFPTVPRLKVKATVQNIGSNGGEANTFPVTVRLVKPGSDVRPGMAAEIEFLLPVPGFKTSFALPISALVATSNKTEKAVVFVFDKAKSVVNKRSVMVISVRGNDVLVSTGLKPGEIVAVAGVSFLHDGMKVKLLAAQ